MNQQEIKKAFAGFDNKKIMVIGDVMVDAYLWGEVNRISPEAPVPIVACSKNENRLGGAANVALNLHALGATPILCSVVGQDAKGNDFLALMRSHMLHVNGILQSDGRPTTVKTRVMAQNQQLLRVDVETDAPVGEALEKLLAARIHSLLQHERPDAVIFEDYDKGTITPRLIQDTVAWAKELKIPVLVDPKRRNFGHYKGVDLLKPNFKELTEHLGLRVAKGDFQKLGQAASQLRREMQVGIILTTLSELGVLVSHNGDFHSLPAQSRDIVDVSGAGDTVISVAALCMASGMSVQQMATISNIAGGLVCEKSGVVPVDKRQLLEEALRFFKIMG